MEGMDNPRRKFVRVNPFRFVPRPKVAEGPWEAVLDDMVATRRIKSWRYRAHGDYVCVVRIYPTKGPSWDTHKMALRMRMSQAAMDIPMWLTGDQAEEWKESEDEFLQFLYAFMKQRLEMGVSTTGNACAPD
jgi:hypothetical protein